MTHDEMLAQMEKNYVPDEVKNLLLGFTATVTSVEGKNLSALCAIAHLLALVSEHDDDLEARHAKLDMSLTLIREIAVDTLGRLNEDATCTPAQEPQN